MRGALAIVALLFAGCCGSGAPALEPTPPAAKVIDARVTAFLPAGDADTYVLDKGAEHGVAVGDRGVLACRENTFVVTEVFEVRSKATRRRAGETQVAKEARITLGGAEPEPWCP